MQCCKTLDNHKQVDEMTDSLKVLLVIQLATIVTIVLDIPIARQILGFIYVSFLPGMLILRIIKMKMKSIWAELCFSVGLSIAFFMFVGLAVNGLYPFFGVSQPLSTIPILVTLSAVLLLLTFVSRNTVSRVHSFSLPSAKKVVQVVLLASIPFLAIFGAISANTWILLLMIVAIAVLAVVAIFYRKSMPSEFYPIAILIMAISLIFQVEFVSKNLFGWDVFGEFYVFKLTVTNSLWNPALSIQDYVLANYNSMLSLTILPTIYSELLNIPGEWIFKIVYFLLYAFVPLSIYQMYKQDFGKSTAFLSAFYFVLFPRFYGEEKRQIIGELFLVLLIFTILNRNIIPRKKQFLLIVFGAALVTSHYSISFLFLFCILFAWAIASVKGKLSTTKTNLGQRKIISARFLLLMLVLNISWYALVSPSIGNTVTGLANHVITSFSSDFSNLDTRGGTVSDFVAPDFSGISLTYKANYVINKIPYLLIIVGFIALIVNRGKKKIQMEYFPIVLAVISILLMTLFLPFFANAFLAERYYHVSLIFLAPVCFYGGIELTKLVLKPFTNAKRARSVSLRILCLLFVLIFLFKVGFVNEITGDVGVGVSRSISFTRLKTSTDPQILKSFYEPLVPESDVCSARWLSSVTAYNSKIYADNTADEHVLRAYTMRIVEWQDILSNGTTIDPDAYVYLRSLNIQGFLVGHGGQISNMTEISNQLSWADKIYSNGGSEVYLTVKHG